MTPKEMMEQVDELEPKNIEKEIEKKARMNNARRSPYPTVVIEIQAAPPSAEDDMREQIVPESGDDGDLESRGVLKEIVSKLESIFAKSAALHKKMDGKNRDDILFDSIGNVSGSFHF